MKTTILITICIFQSLFAFSQVGINTKNPIEMLDIEGSLQIRSDLNLGLKDDLETINPGKKSDYLHSQGANNPPIWKSLPNYYWGITHSISVYDDQNGVVYGPHLGYVDSEEGTEVVDGREPTSQGMTLDSPNIAPWINLKSLAGDLYITDKDAKIGFSFQSVVQLSARNGDGMADVSVGVFLDDKLKSARTLQIAGTGRQFYPISLSDVIENLSPKPDGSPYHIQVAVRLRYARVVFSLPEEERKIYIGRGAVVTTSEGPNATDFMNASSFVAHVYQFFSL